MPNVPTRSPWAADSVTENGFGRAGGLLACACAAAPTSAAIARGKINAATTDELVRLMEIDGEEVLFYKAFPIHVGNIRATTATMRADSMRQTAAMASCVAECMRAQVQAVVAGKAAMSI